MCLKLCPKLTYIVTNTSNRCAGHIEKKDTRVKCFKEAHVKGENECGAFRRKKDTRLGKKQNECGTFRGKTDTSLTPSQNELLSLLFPGIFFAFMCLNSAPATLKNLLEGHTTSLTRQITLSTTSTCFLGKVDSDG